MRKCIFNHEVITLKVNVLANYKSLPLIPVKELGETGIPINFSGVNLLLDDYIYIDNSGIILSPAPLDI